MYTLDQKLGSALLRTIPMEFSLTVPAIWTEAAKDKTLKAWKKASGDSKEQVISLVSEPVCPRLSGTVSQPSRYRCRN
jgi:molecular chaperone DnaK (HSP70)